MIRFYFPKAKKRKPHESIMQVQQMQTQVAPRLAELRDESAEREARRKNRSLLTEKGRTQTRFGSLGLFSGGRSTGSASLLGGR